MANKGVRLRIGSWILSKSMEDYNCADCKQFLPRTEKSWRCSGRAGVLRRVCVGCMEKRQAMRGRTVETAAREVAA